MSKRVDVDPVLQEMREKYAQEQALVQLMREMLFPQQRPTVPGYELGWSYWPAPQQGLTGDFYNAVITNDKYFHFVIGDVSGKGPAAAYISMNLAVMWRWVVAENFDPKIILRRMNRGLILMRLLGEDDFVTLLCGGINLKSGALHYAVAGHPPAILHRAAGRCELLVTQGPPLGIKPDATFETSCDLLGQGDTLLLYTDGISELRRGADWLGHEGLQNWLKGCSETDPAKLIAGLHKQAQTWCHNKFHDDIALFVIRRNG